MGMAQWPQAWLQAAVQVAGAGTVGGSAPRGAHHSLKVQWAPLVAGITRDYLARSECVLLAAPRGLGMGLNTQQPGRGDSLGLEPGESPPNPDHVRPDCQRVRDARWQQHRSRARSHSRPAGRHAGVHARSLPKGNGDATRAGVAPRAVSRALRRRDLGGPRYLCAPPRCSLSSLRAGCLTVAWYLRTLDDRDTHFGTFSRGVINAEFGIRF